MIIFFSFRLNVHWILCWIKLTFNVILTRSIINMFKMSLINPTPFTISQFLLNSCTTLIKNFKFKIFCNSKKVNHIKAHHYFFAKGKPNSTISSLSSTVSYKVFFGSNLSKTWVVRLMGVINVELFHVSIDCF